MKDRERACEQVDAKLMVNGNNVEQINVKISTRTLEVYITPALEWTV